MAWTHSAKSEGNYFTIYHSDTLGNTNNERFKFTIAIEDITRDTAVALDAFARGFVNLTKDNYEDSKVFTSKNLDTNL